jgi:predicted transcriptional regulator
MYDLLKATDRYGPYCSKSDMSRGSRTAYLQMARYLDWAITSKLIVEEQLNSDTQYTYRVTERGDRFIELVDELQGSLYVSSFAQTRYPS